MRGWIEGETAHRGFSWGKYGRVGLNEGQIANTARMNRAGVRIDSEYKNNRRPLANDERVCTGEQTTRA